MNERELGREEGAQAQGRGQGHPAARDGRVLREGVADAHEQVRSPLTPRIYVASLSDYNAGRLHGEWIDAEQSKQAIFSEIEAMLARSREPSAEEFAIHDYEGFSGLRIDEYESIDRVVRLAAGLADHGVAFAHWARRCSEEVSAKEWESELDRFSDAFLGVWESEQAYAEELLAEQGITEILDATVPAGLRPYVTVDYVAFASELFGELWSVRDSAGVWVFDNS